MAVLHRLPQCLSSLSSGRRAAALRPCTCRPAVAVLQTGRQRRRPKLRFSALPEQRLPLAVA
eukprot:6124069-Lingulodinium_polyedra.AAC.1